MLDMQRVVSLFSLFSDVEGEEQAAWRGFCEAAAAYVEARLKADADPQAHMELLCSTAAGVAFSDYLAVQSMGGGHSSELRVGDIFVKDSGSAGGIGGADDIRAHFLGMAAHLLAPEYPALLPVGGKP